MENDIIEELRKIKKYFDNKPLPGPKKLSLTPEFVKLTPEQWKQLDIALYGLHVTDEKGNRIDPTVIIQKSTKAYKI